MIEDKKLKTYILYASIILFVFSLTQKCYCTTSNCSDSIMVLILGWAAFSAGAVGMVWFANPLLFASWFFLKRNLKTAMFLSVFSFLLSLSFLMFDSILDNEGGIPHEIISYRLGYWLWVLSHLVMLLGTFVLMLTYNTRRAMK
jgi:hypothetical protein